MTTSSYPRPTRGSARRRHIVGTVCTAALVVVTYVLALDVTSAPTPNAASLVSEAVPDTDISRIAVRAAASQSNRKTEDEFSTTVTSSYKIHSSIDDPGGGWTDIGVWGEETVILLAGGWVEVRHGGTCRDIHTGDLRTAPWFSTARCYAPTSGQ